MPHRCSWSGKSLWSIGGHPPADLEALEETLLRMSRLVEEISEISELDLNPIFALPLSQGCRIVDARIHLAHGRKSFSVDFKESLLISVPVKDASLLRCPLIEHLKTTRGMPEK